MKKIILAGIVGLITFNSCQQKSTKDSTEIQKLSAEAIVVHDEIMPQISHFDRATIKIDSILENLAGIAQKDNTIDTATVKSDLETLKVNLEDATDNMMTWMRDYAPDSTDVSYQKVEIEKIKAMKKQFEDVSLESNTKLGKF
ncbi:transposase [Sphingobacterium bovistauri]|uniref:Transposase n=1 Tax=Sphingobacterium bovistauri TaxID=2781959 RepID=A0ABS7Z824_9SPHI|nr:transposase [Sphingobacterium bovistauri]MCA5006336.1 transposase [Sphingobacterium bovistauri]